MSYSSLLGKNIFVISRAQAKDCIIVNGSMKEPEIIV